MTRNSLNFKQPNIGDIWRGRKRRGSAINHQEHPHSSENGGVGKVPPGGGLVSEKRGDVPADGANGTRGACAIPEPRTTEAIQLTALY